MGKVLVAVAQDSGSDATDSRIEALQQEQKDLLEQVESTQRVHSIRSAPRNPPMTATKARR